MPIRFRFRWVPFIATAIAMAIGISLGQWQMGRAAEKRTIETKWNERASLAPMKLRADMSAIGELEYRKVLVRGEFVSSWPLYLDNRPHAGAAGFYHFMPLKISGSDMHILVARGWVPRNANERTRLPDTATPSGQIEFVAIVKRNAGRVFDLGASQNLRPSAIVQNLSIEEFANASGLKMLPFILEQVSDTRDGLVREWPIPSAGADKHLGYAFQWYALAATAFIFFLVTGLRRGTK